ncbi:MAG TPA: hypothetical protein EYH31_11100 [Anaerolineae bacterium]|nr:hypothetical protein [Anaerolineae bacterium]
MKLERERDELQEDLEHLRELLRGEVDVDIEESDPDLFERDKNLALLTKLERRIESINTALRSIERGTYGICERCGQPIDPARLEARPDAILCLKCQLEVERLVRRGVIRVEGVRQG